MSSIKKTEKILLDILSNKTRYKGRVCKGCNHREMRGNFQHCMAHTEKFVREAVEATHPDPFSLHGQGFPCLWEETSLLKVY